MLSLVEILFSFVCGCVNESETSENILHQTTTLDLNWENKTFELKRSIGNFHVLFILSLRPGSKRNFKLQLMSHSET